MSLVVGPAYARDPPAQDKHLGVVAALPSAVSSPAGAVGDQEGGRAKWEICEVGEGRSGKREAAASSESSSIGVAGDSDEEDDEVQSKFSGGLGSLGSLEDSLPIKRGLSNYFSGKSKSFANLSEVSRVEDLGKAENPFSKRRRTLLANKYHLWSKSTFSSSSSSPSSSCSFYVTPNPTSMPLLFGALKGKKDVVQEEEEEEEDEDVDGKNTQSSDSGEEKKFRRFNQRKPQLGKMEKKPFRSPSCFSLADLPAA